MSTDLTLEVAIALYNLEPLVTGYGDRERKLTWSDALLEGYGLKYIERATAAIPLVLKWAEEAVSMEMLVEPQDEDDKAYDRGVFDSLNAIRSLREES